MKKMNSHVPAFTIIEALISMVITAIILSIIFVIFSITSERLMDFKKQNEAISDYNRMGYSVNKSIFESNFMKLNNSEELVFSDSYGNEVYFRIYDNYFTMEKNEYTDTFHLKTSGISLDELESISKRAKFKRLKWQLNINDKKTEINFYKKMYWEETTKPVQ